MAALSVVGDRKREDFKVGLVLGGVVWAGGCCDCCEATNLSVVGVVSVVLVSCGSGNTLRRE